MTADTQAQGDLDLWRKKRQEWRKEINRFEEMLDSTNDPKRTEAFAAALQGRGTQEGEPSDAMDAARYRWLRERNAVLDSCPIFTAIRTVGPDGKFAGNDLIAGEEMDAAIDEARAALAQAQKERTT